MQGKQWQTTPLCCMPKIMGLYILITLRSNAVFSTPKRKEKCEQSTKERICIVHNFKHKNYDQLKAITNKKWTKIQDIKIM